MRAWIAGATYLMACQVTAASYTIAVEDVDYFPIYSTADGQYRGYARELLDLFARHSGHQFTYLPLPIKRITPYHVRDRVDLVYPDHPRWGKAQKQGRQVHYSAPTLTFQDVILVQPARLGLPMRTLGMVRGFTPWKYLAEVEAGQIKVEEAPGPANLLRMTLLGRVDGANMALQVGRYHLLHMGIQQALVPDPKHMPIQDSQYYLSSIRHPKLIAEFDRFIKTEHATIEALQHKYGF
ncbi:transporter substrate-binding domain-containing protein [Chitinimonas viridis]|uniref:Transporter substrate-binding domain-containing protein n=1 Tax=Chitinimonas viridis TaxID=664880 RepID=A0ABT8AYV9_9NEIS|nr:transporter substrate-binding domain-containing protein [Chitinimonas viridis]MDN3575167.1 transporter substrate-binding domain-containing protein [Chitinimonas viridis]